MLKISERQRNQQNIPNTASTPFTNQIFSKRFKQKKKNATRAASTDQCDLI